MIFQRFDNFRGSGIFIMRVGVGIIFILHGYPKIAGGPEVWAKLGGALAPFGITFVPVFWGFMAAFSEFIGGMMIVLGLFTRVAGLMLFITMGVATSMHLNNGDPFSKYSQPMLAAFLFFGFLFIEPGRYSMDNWILKKRK